MQRQGAMRPSGEGRVPVAMRDQTRARLVLYVEQGDAAVPPARVGHVIRHHGMVQGDPPGPIRLFSSAVPHAREPPATDLHGPGGLDHIDDDQHVIGITVEERGRVGVSVADPPDPMQAQTLDFHEADRTRVRRIGDVVDPQPSRVVLAALAEPRAVHTGNGTAVIALLAVEHRVEVELLDGQEVVAMRLAMDRPRRRMHGQEVHGLRLARIAHVQDRDAAAEDVADVGMALRDHDLAPVRPDRLDPSAPPSSAHSLIQSCRCRTSVNPSKRWNSSRPDEVGLAFAAQHGPHVAGAAPSHVPHALRRPMSRHEA